MRAFLGVPLCEAAIAALAPVQTALGQGRLVDEDNLHMTLAFLDDQSEAALEELHGVLEGMLLPAVQMTFEGIDLKGGRKPMLVWASVRRTDALELLHAQVRQAVLRAGIELPRARFRPHVTLARFARNGRLDMARLAGFLGAQGGFRAGPFPVGRMCLYRSTLTPEGPIYDVLSEYVLQ